MSDAVFSTDLAEVETLGYEDIFDRVVNWHWRDSDVWGEDQEPELVRFDVGLRRWQVDAFDHIKGLTGSNYASIYRAAYAQGISKLSEATDRDAINRYNKLRRMMLYSYNEYMNFADGLADRHTNVGSTELSDPVMMANTGTSHGPIESYETVRVIPNHYSQIEGDFVSDLNTDSWIHRSVMTIGLSGAEQLPSKLKKYSDVIVNMLPDVIDSQVFEVEDNFVTYMTVNSNHWQENGIHEPFLLDLEEMADSMSTKNSDLANFLVEQIRDECNVFPDSESEYRRYKEIEENNE